MSREGAVVEPLQSVEKRKHARVDKRVPVKIGSPELDLVTETQNISCSGVYCRVNKYLEPMTKLQITLLIPSRKSGRSASKKIVCSGVVVRTENILHEDGFNVAIFFSDISARNSQLLMEYVQQCLADRKSV